MHRNFFITALVLPVLMTACDKGPLDLNGATQVAVKFSTNSPSASASISPALFASSPTGKMVLTGTNGTLTITNISLIVSELELECDGDEDRAITPACIEFDAPPSFVELPLGTGAVEVTEKPIPSGTYTKLDFEVENLEVEENDDQTKRQQVADLLTSIHQTYPDFPEKASMVVEGDFNGTPFRVYFNAEIEMEMDLVPALTVSDTIASRSLSVNVLPTLWFKKADGTVADLSRYDYATNGQLIEFELEIEKGFKKVEFEH